MKDYDELLEHDAVYAEKAERVSNLTRDIHELLVEYGFEAPTAELNGTVTYQDPCHLKNVQKITDAPRQILNSIPGLDLIELAEPTVCCGSAGTYSITQREMSSQLGKRKARNVVATGANYVATGNPGCSMQLDFALNEVAKDSNTKRTTKVAYVVDLLDMAYAAE